MVVVEGKPRSLPSYYQRVGKEKVMANANTKKNTQAKENTQVFTLTQEQLSSIIEASVKQALETKVSKVQAKEDNSKELKTISKEIDKQKKIICEANKVIASLEAKAKALGGAIAPKTTSKDVETAEIHYWISNEGGFGETAKSSFNAIRFALAKSNREGMSQASGLKFDNDLKSLKEAVKKLAITKVIVGKASVIFLKKDMALSLKNLKDKRMAKVSIETLRDWFGSIVVDNSAINLKVDIQKKPTKKA